MRISIDDNLEVSGSWKATEFEVDQFGLVHEPMTWRYYDAQTGKGWLNVGGRRVALTSYECFGADMYQAAVAAKHWCAKAQAAWDAYVKMCGVPCLD